MYNKRSGLSLWGHLSHSVRDSQVLGLYTSTKKDSYANGLRKGYDGKWFGQRAMLINTRPSHTSVNGIRWF
jgi:hypothetical protein